MDLMNLIVPRQELNTGTVLNLDNEQCIINSVRGIGASSIVYEATLNNRRIILKELYPTSMGILRAADNSLIIPEKQKDKFQNSKMALKRAFNLQLQFFNEFPNHIVEPQKLYEYNNTLYIVMHLSNGSSYDDVKPTDILAIFEVAKSLSAAIGFYHKKGYLNLDIKPENLFIFPETNQLIQLFDFDTVATKEDVMQGRFSYSHGYAAPEVRGSRNGNAQLSDIDERADIFSIGVVIFEKIMGRMLEYSDHREGKIWDLSANPYLKNTVPQLQTGIMELFRKTIAREKNDRYLSVAELIKDLDKLIELASIKVFLKSQNISPCTAKNIYIPRKNVCDNIYEKLNLYHILYLYTIRGNGKSETAREYAEIYTDKYNFIQSIFYSQNLKKTIANLDFVGLKQEDKIAHTDEDIDRLYSYKLDLLGNTDIYTSNTLLIIDNYDYDSNPESEEYKQNVKVLADLRKLHIHIIFTTRINPTDKAHCFKLPDMSKQELEELFFKINPVQKDDSDRKRLVDEIIEASYNHTMTVKLVALQSKKYKKSLEEYLSKLKENGINSHIQGRITNEKDDESVTMSAVYDHIKALFDFDNLSDKEKYVMVNACLLPLEGLDTVTFSDFIDLDNFDDSSSDCIDESIEDLVNSGWINYTDNEEKKISLHPLICDVVTNELQPELTEEKCRKFYISFLDLISEWGNNKFSNNDIYLSLEKNVICLFPRLNNVFKYQPVCDIVNGIIFYGRSDYSTSRIVDYSIRTYDHNQENVYLSNCFSIEKEYTISPEITMIEENTFDNCCFLEKVYIDNSNDFYRIYAISFYNCPIKEFIVLNSPFYSSYDGALYNFEKTKLIKCPAAKEKISIAESVTEIGYDSFNNCNITEISLPNSMFEISCAIFQDLNIKKINIPEGIDVIPFYAFRNCKYLECVHLPNTIEIIGQDAFNGCSSLKYINFPEKLEVIYSGAFKNCKSLKKIITLGNLKEIQDFAFYGCEALETVIVPQTLEHIGSLAFGECSNLKNINVNRPTRVSYDAFCGCMSLMKCMDVNIKIENNSMIWDLRDESILMGIYDKSIKSYVMQDHILYLGAFCFKNCDKLKWIALNDNLNIIMDYAFQNCISLEKIIIPNSVDTISTGAFQNCCSLQEIKLSERINVISDRTFFNCKKLASILIPDSVEKIEDGVFANCESLHHISLSSTLTELGFCVFENCQSINSLDFLCNSSITEISFGTFMGCKSLVHIKIPDQIISVEEQAFANCENIQSIILSKIEVISELTFAYCASLSNINLPKTVKEIEDFAYAYCSSLKFLTLPENVEYIGMGAFVNCDILNNITILNSNMNIDKFALGYILPFNKGLLECYSDYNENEEEKEPTLRNLMEKNKNLIIRGYRNSTAEEYAQENGFTFVPLDES